MFFSVVLITMTIMTILFYLRKGFIKIDKDHTNQISVHEFLDCFHFERNKFNRMIFKAVSHVNIISLT